MRARRSGFSCVDPCGSRTTAIELKGNEAKIAWRYAGVTPSGRLDIAPPRGVPVQPAQQPTRRFYPTNQPVQPSQGGGFFGGIFGR